MKKKTEAAQEVEQITPVEVSPMPVPVVEHSPTAKLEVVSVITKFDSDLLQALRLITEPRFHGYTIKYDPAAAKNAHFEVSVRYLNETKNKFVNLNALGDNLPEAVEKAISSIGE